MMLLTPDPGLFSFINQGALTVDGIDDVEEMKIADVSNTRRWCQEEPILLKNVFTNLIFFSVIFIIKIKLKICWNR